MKTTIKILLLLGIGDAAYFKGKSQTFFRLLVKLLNKMLGTQCKAKTYRSESILEQYKICTNHNAFQPDLIFISNTVTAVGWPHLLWTPPKLPYMEYGRHVNINEAKPSMCSYYWKLNYYKEKKF